VFLPSIRFRRRTASCALLGGTRQSQSGIVTHRITVALAAHSALAVRANGGGATGRTRRAMSARPCPSGHRTSVWSEQARILAPVPHSAQARKGLRTAPGRPETGCVRQARLSPALWGVRPAAGQFCKQEKARLEAAARTGIASFWRAASPSLPLRRSGLSSRPRSSR
jgi:hypothetical protein